MKYYKVTDQEMGSCMITKTEARVIYKLGEWVESKSILTMHNYHLLVFNSIESAIRFIIAGENKKYRLWEVDVKDEISVMPPRGYVYNYVDYKVIYLSAYPMPWPEGTKMFKQVKLIKEIAIYPPAR